MFFLGSSSEHVGGQTLFIQFKSACVNREKEGGGRKKGRLKSHKSMSWLLHFFSCSVFFSNSGSGGETLFKRARHNHN